MQIKTLMTKNVEVISPDESLREAADRMSTFNIGMLPVCENDRLIGVITDRDIVIRAVAPGLDPAQTTTRRCMTENVLYCFEDSDVDEAARQMQEAGVRRLLVLNASKRLVGILSLRDLSLQAGEELTGEVVAGISEQAPTH